MVSRGRAKDLAEVGEFLEGQPEAAAYASLLSDDKTAADVMLLKVMGQIAAVALVSLYIIYKYIYIYTCVCVYVLYTYVYVLYILIYMLSLSHSLSLSLSLSLYTSRCLRHSRTDTSRCLRHGRARNRKYIRSTTSWSAS